MKIKNFEELAGSDSGRHALLSIVEAGLESIDTQTAIASRISIENNTLYIGPQQFPLKNVDRIIVVGVGKCSLDAAIALEKVLGEKLTGGIVIDVRCDIGVLKKIECYQGTHPFPSPTNVDVTKKIIARLSNLSERDLVICIVSGGGSVLLCQPSNSTCQDEEMIMRELMRRGAGIKEVNTIRKHTSSARGGFLAQYAFPAQVVSLIFSDVPNNDLGFIASGPTVKDTTTIADAEAIARRYGLFESIGFMLNHTIETPKDDKYFRRVANILFLSNETALEAMATKAREIGFTTEVCSSCLTGEARVVGKNIIGEIATSAKFTARLYAGETTVVIAGKGRGGRNQELALSALEDVGESQYLAAVASDGVDNGPYAGAICDTIGKKQAEKLGLTTGDFLNNNDSSSFFEATGSALKTGHTGSNISDFVVALHI
jgi:glycerate 2-kinase